MASDNDTTPRAGDLKHSLVRKILLLLSKNSIGTGEYHAPRPGDSVVALWRKILIKLGQ